MIIIIVLQINARLGQSTKATVWNCCSAYYSLQAFLWLPHFAAINTHQKANDMLLEDSFECMHHYCWGHVPWTTIQQSSQSVHQLTERRAAQSSLEGLGHGEITSVGEWRLNKLLLYSEVLKAVVELGVCHVNAQLLEHVGILRIKVEAHLSQPVKRLGVWDTVLHQDPGHVSLMH